jgi:protein-disulfide isomerase
MWKYAADQGVFATPTVFVNGIRLQNAPFIASDWLTLLDQVYKSQKVGL